MKTDHWWFRKSAWYERIAMILVAVGGAAMAVYMPMHWLLAQDGVIGEAKALAFGIAVILTVMGIAALIIGSAAAFHAFRPRHERMLISHLEAAIIMIVIVSITIPFVHAVHAQMRIS